MANIRECFSGEIGQLLVETDNCGNQLLHHANGLHAARRIQRVQP
jgi:hypothetical protein